MQNRRGSVPERHKMPLDMDLQPYNINLHLFLLLRLENNYMPSNLHNHRTSASNYDALSQTEHNKLYLMTFYTQAMADRPSYFCIDTLCADKSNVVDLQAEISAISRSYRMQRNARS